MRGIDFLLRHAQGVKEFSQQEECILRLGLGRARKGHVLSDGMVVRSGELVGQVHLWNERLPLMGCEGPDLAWAQAFRRRFARSLEELAAYVESEPSLAGVRAFCGETTFALADLEAARRFAQRLGFDFLEQPEGERLWRRFTRFWDNLYALMLMWTYNPASLRGKALGRLQRCQVWISRERLLGSYGDKVAKGDSVPDSVSAPVERGRRVDGCS